MHDLNAGFITGRARGNRKASGHVIIRDDSAITLILQRYQQGTIGQHTFAVSSSGGINDFFVGGQSH